MHGELAMLLMPKDWQLSCQQAITARPLPDELPASCILHHQPRYGKADTKNVALYAQMTGVVSSASMKAVWLMRIHAVCRLACCL